MEYIDINNEIYPVISFKKGKKEGFKAGVAYRKSGMVYPYRGKYSKGLSTKVGVYHQDDDIVIIFPSSKKQLLKYSAKNIYKLDSIDDILEIIDGITPPNIDVIMGETDTVFAPVVGDKDNFLQALIKYALQFKKIDLKHYKSRFADPADLSNHRKGILKHGKMSAEKMIKWATVLDLDYEITIKDKPNCPNPMGKEISYSSTDGFKFKDGK